MKFVSLSFFLHFQHDHPRNGHGVSTKENVPPKPRTPDSGGGIIGKLGSHDDKRKRLQEERKKEYNQMLAEVRFTHSSSLQHFNGNCVTVLG